MMSIKWLFAAALLGLSSVSQAGTFTHVLKSFGYGRPAEQCNNDLLAVADQFSRDAGVDILGAACLPNGNVGNSPGDGHITYVASEAVTVATSDVRPSSGFDGHYTSMESCLDALRRERSVFINQTGLRPFVGYCFKGSVVGAPRYRARLDAVGSSTVRKLSLRASWSNMLVDPERVQTDLGHLAFYHRLLMFESSFERYIVSWQVTVDAYGESNVRLHSGEALRWMSLEDCETQTTALIDRWALNAPKLVAACDKLARGTTHNFGLVYFWMSESVFPNADIRASTLPQAYQTLAACEADRARIERTMSSNGMDVYATLCGYHAGTNQLRMMTFTP